MVGLAGIIVSYLPAFVYYQYHQNQYNIFIGEVSQRYKERIRDEQLEEFKR